MFETEVNRLRRVALQRKQNHRVGMVLSVDQVLALIARGDAVEALTPQPPLPGGEGELMVRLTEAAELCEISPSAVNRLVRGGQISGEKRRETCEDGNTRHVWYVNVEELMVWVSLERAEKHEVSRGERELVRREACGVEVDL